MTAASSSSSPSSSSSSDSFEFSTINEVGDRSESLRLLGALLDPHTNDELCEQILYSLREVGDPRCEERLLAVLDQQTTNPNDEHDVITYRAANALLAIDARPHSERLTSWIRTANSEVRGLALRYSGRDQADLLAAVLDDPNAPSEDKANALHGISFDFEEPVWLDRLVRCIDHPDDEVAATAANVAFWPEPVFAEDALLRALARAGDVSVDAADTLRYYPTKRVLAALDAYACPDVLLNRNPTSPFHDALETFVHALQEPEAVAARMRKWMGPWAQRIDDDATFAAMVANWNHENAASQAKPASDSGAAGSGETDAIRAAMHTKRRTTLPWSPDLAARCSDPNSFLQPLLADLRELDSDSIPLVAREQFVSDLCRNSASEVRCQGASHAANLGMVDLVLELMDDETVVVRKSAVYEAKALDLDVRIADRCFAILGSGVCGTQATEAVATWSRHADEQVVRAQLVSWAQFDKRESVVRQSLEELLTMPDHVSSIQTLLPLLNRQPLHTWCVHVSLLEGCERLGHDPGDLSHLRGVDNVWLQTAIVRLDVALGR